MKLSSGSAARRLKIHLDAWSLEDAADLTRLFLTTIPLRGNDARLRLLSEVRGAIIKENRKTGERWIELDSSGGCKPTPSSSMKPSLRVHFSNEHPNRPGLWISRRANYIAVLQVDDSDIERDKRQDGAWLDGEWAAHLELVDHDVVPLDKRRVQEHLDTNIGLAHENKDAARVKTLQDLRVALIGQRLELPEPETE